MANRDNSRLFISESFLASLVILTALTLRILHAIFTSKLNPLAGDLVLDAAIYDNWAKALVWGSDSGTTHLMQAPLFPWFVSAVYRIFGPAPGAVRALQALLGTFTCAFTIVYTRRLFRSSTTGIVAGFIMALYLPSIFYEGVMAPVTLVLFLNSLFIFLMVPESRYPSDTRLLLAGFVLGLSILAKPVALLLLPFALFHLMLRTRKFEAGFLVDRKREWRFSLASFFRRAVILTLGLVIAVAPLTIRNAKLTGEFIPLTTGGGINFYIGNNPKANGFYSVPFFKGSPLGGSPEEQRQRMHDIASAESGRILSYSEVSDFWMKKGIEYDMDNPGRWAALVWQKFLFFWNRYERASIESLSFHRRFGGILALPLLSFGMIAPLGLLGIFISRNRGKRLWLLYGGVWVYLFAALFFYVLARYRLPLIVFIVPFAGASVAGLLKFVRDRRWGELALLFAAFLLIAKLINTTVAEDTATGKSGQLVRLGNIYARQGDSEKAKTSFKEALGLHPGNLQARKSLETLGESGPDIEYEPGD